MTIGVFLGEGIDCVLSTVSTKSYNSDERAIEIVCSVNPGLGIVYPPVDVFHRVINFGLQHDPVEGDLRDALDEVRIELTRIEVLTGHKPDLCEARNFSGVCSVGRICLHQLSKQLEIRDCIHAIDL